MSADAKLFEHIFAALHSAERVRVQFRGRSEPVFGMIGGLTPSFPTFNGRPGFSLISADGVEFVCLDEIEHLDRPTFGRGWMRTVGEIRIQTEPAAALEPPPAVINGLPLPKHLGGLTLEHNPHLGHYEGVAAWATHSGIEEEDWVDAIQCAKAVGSNSVWVLTWYPDTPVGLCTLCAADLDVLLAAAAGFVPDPKKA